MQFPPDVGDDAIHIVHHSPLRVEELVNTIQEKFNPFGKRAYEPGSKHSISKVVVKAWLQEVTAHCLVPKTHRWSSATQPVT